MPFRSGLARLPFFESCLSLEEILSAGFADLLAAISIYPAVSANVFAGCFLAATCTCRQGAACMPLLSAFAAASGACALANGATAEIDVPTFSRLCRLNSLFMPLHGSVNFRIRQGRQGTLRDAGRIGQPCHVLVAAPSERVVHAPTFGIIPLLPSRETLVDHVVAGPFSHGCFRAMPASALRSKVLSPPNI